MGGNGEGFLQVVLDALPFGVLVVDTTGVVTWHNHAALAVLGTPALRGVVLRDCFDSEAGHRVNGLLQGAEVGGGECAIEVEHTVGGVRRWIEMSAADRRADPVLGGVVVSVADRSAARSVEDELRARVNVDTLTGLLNRSGFTAALRGAVAYAERVAVIFFDIDQFKIANDRWGHAIGDQILCEVALRLVHQAGGAPVGRIGGDEFAVLLTGGEGEQASALATRVVSALAEPLSDNPDVRVEVSAGVVDTGSARSAERLMRYADLAMYAAKVRDDRVQTYRPELAGWLERRKEQVAHLDEIAADNERLAELARTDELTQVGNRRQWLEDAARLDHTTRAAGGTYALAFCDLDLFHELNRVLGDRTGDTTLREVAAVLTGACRGSDTVYRKGGEEFVVLLPDTNLAAATDIGERLRAAVANAKLPAAEGTLTVSIGVAALSARSRTFAEVVDEAEVAMRQAKDAGRDRVVASTAIVAAASDLRSLPDDRR